jgi:type III restriction enzyme
MEFVESIKSEGVELERKPMGEGTGPKSPLIVEVDLENTKRILISLILKSLFFHPEYTGNIKIYQNSIRHASGTKNRISAIFRRTEAEIIFKDITTNDINHITLLDTTAVADYRSVIGYFTKTIMKDLRLVSGYDILYGKMKEFITDHLFTKHIEIDDLNTLRNLSELNATKAIIECFKKYINELTVKDKGETDIRDYIKLRKTRPFVVKDQGYIIPRKSVFNKIIGDSGLELEFTAFLEDCDDIISYAKNFLAVHFTIDYINKDGFPSNYYPDFLVKVSEKEIVIVETKGLEDMDVPEKMGRLKQWCEDINIAQSEFHFDYAYVDEAGFQRYRPKNFNDLMKTFREYKG